MAVVIAALLPVFLLIVLGFILKRTLIQPETQWHGLERLTYYVLLPVFLVQTLVKADLSTVPVAVSEARCCYRRSRCHWCVSRYAPCSLAPPLRPGLHLDISGRDTMADLCRARGLQQSLWQPRVGAGIRRHDRHRPAGQRVLRFRAGPIRFGGKAVGRLIVVTVGETP